MQVLKEIYKVYKVTTKEDNTDFFYVDTFSNEIEAFKYIEIALRNDQIYERNMKDYCIITHYILSDV